MIGIELMWWRCPDGTEFHDYGPARPATKTKSVKLGGDVAREGAFIRWRTDQQRPYDKRITDLKNSMVERFIRCSTREDFVSFTSEFGMPGATTAEGLREVSVKSLEESRDGLKKIFDLNAAGKITNAIRLLNSRTARIAPLTPLLTQWPSSPSPVMMFLIKHPYGFMLMETALAIGNATVLLTCNHCTRPFLAGALTSKRTNAYFCSNKCRVAAQRAAAGEG